MLEMAMNLNVLITLIVTIITFRKTYSKNANLNNLNAIATIYSLYIFSFGILWNLQLTDVGLELLLLNILFLAEFIATIVNIFIIVSKIKKQGKTTLPSYDAKKVRLVLYLPLIIFLVPYLYELYILNNCSYLLSYNYQNGIIISEDTYIAIINNKPITITLEKNLFTRKPKNSHEHLDIDGYTVTYEKDGAILIEKSYDEIVNITDLEEDVSKIIMKLKKDYPKTSKVYIDYFKEKKYILLALVSEEGSINKEYFYYNNKYIPIQTHGNLVKVTYYGG